MTYHAGTTKERFCPPILATRSWARRWPKNPMQTRRIFGRHASRERRLLWRGNRGLHLRRRRHRCDDRFRATVVVIMTTAAGLEVRESEGLTTTGSTKETTMPSEHGRPIPRVTRIETRTTRRSAALARPPADPFRGEKLTGKPWTVVEVSGPRRHPRRPHATIRGITVATPTTDARHTDETSRRATGRHPATTAVEAGAGVEAAVAARHAAGAVAETALRVQFRQTGLPRGRVGLVVRSTTWNWRY